MIHVYIGEKDPNFIPTANCLEVEFEAGESLDSIKRKIIDLLPEVDGEWAGVLLEDVKGGPFKDEAGIFVFSWDEL
jgi:hypothetical protein